MKARRYTKMAADKGNTYAQEVFMLMLFKEKEGLAQLGEALRYGMMAAASGSEFAQGSLPTILAAIEGEHSWH